MPGGAREWLCQDGVPVVKQAPVHPHRDPMESNRGATIFTLGLVGILVCQPVGIMAWVMANRDLQRIAAGEMDGSGDGLGFTKAGKICGIISVVLIGLILVGAVFFAIAMVGMGMSMNAGGAMG